MKNSPLLRHVATAMFLIAVTFTAPLPAHADGEQAVEAHLASLIGAGDTAPGTERLTAIRDVYAGRGFALLWSDGRETNEKGAWALDVLRSAGLDGLAASDYLAELGTIPERFGTQADAARFDVSLSDAMLKYLSDLRTGRVSPARLEPDLFVQNPVLDFRAALTALSTASDLPKVVRDHMPANPVYRNLRDSLAVYRRLATNGGWPGVPEGPKLEQGMTDPRVAALRARLEVNSPLLKPSATPEVFDDALHRAVVDFQNRHGLAPDGVVGPATLAALNVRVEERVDQIRLNMERLRWMPDDLGARHVLVNIAAFELYGVVDGNIRKRMRVVVGRDYRRTPVFSDAIRYMEVNPYWHVPPKIARKDLLPKIQADPGFISANGYTVLDGWGANARPVDPSQINWAALGSGTLPYKLRQNPGAKNALGRIKFMFPNKHDVYLHDTPSRELFDRNIRTFSSGCIRVEDPDGLARFLIDLQPTPDTARLETAMAGTKTTIIQLTEPVPVHLTYFTAWADESGVVNFRTDIYERDKALASALGQYRI